MMSKYIKHTLEQLKSQIVEYPSSYAWVEEDNAKSLAFDGEFTFDEDLNINTMCKNDGKFSKGGEAIILNDHEKMLVFILAYNLTDTCPFKRTVMRHFNWTAYKVQKLFKELKEDVGLDCIAVFDEETGLLAGKGYFIDEHFLNTTT